VVPVAGPSVMPSMPWPVATKTFVTTELHRPGDAAPASPSASQASQTNWPSKLCWYSTFDRGCSAEDGERSTACGWGRADGN